jgi:outer membrane protein OmpA-like peptidoglycan-associated protein
MNTKKILLCSALCLSLGACAYSGPRQVPRPNIPMKNYTSENHHEDRMDRKAYNEYDNREQCQEYRRVPRNSVFMSHCKVRKAPAMKDEGSRRLLGVINTYTLYFDFDKDNIRQQDWAVIDRIANELDKYDPAQITVTGFADRSGSVDYNQDLSERRANSVSKALLDRSIATETVNEEARGELDPAVPTPDGVRLQENRRVVVDFRR